MIWKIVAPYFKRTERWGDPDKISGLTLLALWQIRVLSGWPIIIHCAYAIKGHNPRGYHPKGMAVDFHFDPLGDINYLEQIQIFSKQLVKLNLDNFIGLGIYPDWKHPGFHFDTRGYRARWGRLGKEYVGFNEAYQEIQRRL